MVKFEYLLLDYEGIEDFEIHVIKYKHQLMVEKLSAFLFENVKSACEIMDLGYNE